MLKPSDKIWSKKHGSSRGTFFGRSSNLTCEWCSQVYLYCLPVKLTPEMLTNHLPEGWRIMVTPLNQFWQRPALQDSILGGNRMPPCERLQCWLLQVHRISKVACDADGETPLRLTASAGYIKLVRGLGKGDASIYAHGLSGETQ